MSALQYFKNLRIGTKFILWFLAIALMPLALTTYISYTRSISVLKNETNKNLLAIADNKVNRIESYLIDQRKNAINLSHTSEIADAMVKFNEALHRGGGMDSAEYSAVNTEFEPFLKYYQEATGYMNVLLMSPDGEVLFSVTKNNNINSLYEMALHAKSESADTPEMFKVFIKAKDSQETEMSDFEYHPQTKKASVFISTPIFKGAEFIGEVIVEMSNAELSEIVNNYNGLGWTGKTIVATKVANEAVFITPVRFDPKATFNRKIIIGAHEGSDIQKVVRGESGSGITIDYRGKEVLSVWKYLPAFRLGIAVEMDTLEVFASAKKLRNNLLVVSLALLIIVVIVAILMAYFISSPIQELTTVSGIIAKGDLSVRAKASGEDEIGELAKSFNRMTDCLVEAKVNIEKQKNLLEEANKELDSFVYTVSHDLKAPLRGIAAFADFLKQDYSNKLDRQANEYIAKIYSGANHMKQLIEDLLTLSKITRIKNPYEDVDINDLINSVMDRIEFVIKENKVNLKIAPNLPIVHCDRIKVTELFLNLLTNAIKFSSKIVGSIPKVEIGYADIGPAHKFYVKDNGIGIDKKYHKEIFTIFKRLHKQSEYEGTGAGLSIAKKVVDSHKGSIWLDSEPGKGTTFYFTIPKNLKSNVELISGKENVIDPEV